MDTSSDLSGGTAATRPLRSRARAVMKAEVVAVASRLFDEQGFDHTTVDQIAAEAGLSRATFFRYFKTKEDVALDDLHELGRRVAAAFIAQPDGEQPWTALRHAFDVITEAHASDPERSLRFFTMMCETPSLKARHWQKQQRWHELLDPEMRRRLGRPPTPHDPVAAALVGAGLACLDAATEACLACNGTESLASLLDQSMGALGN
ncbi:TetR family transcriptional regulator [Actinacidiphila sp. DG2A-62]|uniref:TetR family transcriptional regulator n=1 Tax=Actinacidiphila sp. DG2A-62 TaxID=3108821 RepID=UPI002DB64B5C|nr:TetR family transcriptional regulator [Actinacidiphila sp. DG2A-62]MEC3992865.1 TetR family transcriptional regulator [Actinacidiphila sp. DG2A-62]